jgi:DNA-binding XRE family transcriptional regulator/CheY-like chemotaxis protein
MRPKKIIILDDDEGIIRVLKSQLKENQVIGFTAADQAVERIRREYFDLFILDYFLFNTTGEDVVRKIREFNKKIYIFLLTGYKDSVPVDETLNQLDIQFYCEKSADVEWVITNIKSVLKTIDFIKYEEQHDSFALRLKQLRIAHNLSQEDIAKIVGGRGRTTIGNWESGLAEPNLETLKKLAAYFGVTIDYLLAYETDFIHVGRDKNGIS